MHYVYDPLTLVHHGNGTQKAFWEDERVLFISVHQSDWYPPKSGMIDEIGAGKGQGYTVRRWVAFPQVVSNPNR